MEEKSQSHVVRVQIPKIAEFERNSKGSFQRSSKTETIHKIQNTNTLHNCILNLKRSSFFRSFEDLVLGTIEENETYSIAVR